MILFRIARRIYARDLDGRGAELYGGRWNTRGNRMIYTSGSRSLAVLEASVHLPTSVLPPDFVLISLRVPDSLKIEEVHTEDLPRDWKQYPFPISTQRIGDEFLLAAQYSLLKVPSVLVESEYNFLINSLHRDAKKIKITKIEPFHFDSRLRK